MSATGQFMEVFEALQGLLRPLAPRLQVTTDLPGHYALDAGYAANFKKTLFFGAAQIKKNYVSFYLMGVYIFPELLTDLSPGLRKRMQGKSCFNFKTVEPALFVELSQLTQLCFQQYEKQGWLVQ